MDTVTPGEIALRDELARLKKDQIDATKLLIRRDLALSRASEQLRALDVAKSEFISVAAHQLRTPLSAMKWIMNMLEKDEFKDSAERQGFIEKGAVSVDRMIQLVNDLLEVDHIESGKKQFVFKTVDLAPVLNLIASDLDILARKRNVTIVTDLMPGSWVMGDIEMLHEVFQNLVENAVKYTLSGGTVTLSSALQGSSVVLTVADTGIGIPADQQRRLFTKFFRAQNAMKVDTTGSGLGLFIAKQIVDRHGGEITLKSAEGEGSTFTVSFPYKPATN